MRWALMVFSGWRALRPRAGAAHPAAVASATCIAVEVAKLWQAPWLVGFRHTTPGHLLLGHVSSRQNLLAYAAGVLAAVGIDRIVLTPGPGGRP